MEKSIKPYLRIYIVCLRFFRNIPRKVYTMETVLQGMFHLSQQPISASRFNYLLSIGLRWSQRWLQREYFQISGAKFVNSGQKKLLPLFLSSGGRIGVWWCLKGLITPCQVFGRQYDTGDWTRLSAQPFEPSPLPHPLPLFKAFNQVCGACITSHGDKWNALYYRW